VLTHLFEPIGNDEPRRTWSEAVMARSAPVVDVEALS
jgi:hypothetical protein